MQVEGLMRARRFKESSISLPSPGTLTESYSSFDAICWPLTSDLASALRELALDGSLEPPSSLSPIRSISEFSSSAPSMALLMAPMMGELSPLIPLSKGKNNKSFRLTNVWLINFGFVSYF